ncbi:MAG: hypothetical protein Kow0065_07790 [Methylomicrobium sp.]
MIGLKAPQIIRVRLLVRAALVGWLALSGSMTSAQADPKVLRVVGDDNYPPYLFRNEAGEADGLAVDIWRLWQQKTGIDVQLTIYQWADAQRIIDTGNADVIETIFRTPEREKRYDYTLPYANLPVGIYSHNSIKGIHQVNNLHGFTIGVMEGDACIEQLTSRGITKLSYFKSYKAVIQAAADQYIKLFCMDEYPANYYFYQLGKHSDFYKAFDLYHGQFHRAVRKGDRETLALVERGMAMIDDDELAALREKWLKEPVDLAIYGYYGMIATGFLAVVGLLLLLWNGLLRKQVRKNTRHLSQLVEDLKAAQALSRQIEDDLNATLEAIPDLLIELDATGRIIQVKSAREGHFIDLPQALPSQKIYEQLPPAMVSALRTAIQAAEHTGNDYERLVHIENADGEVRWLELSTARKRVHEDASPHFIVLCRDVTERKQAEIFKLEQESLYHTAISATPDGFWVVDMQGHILETNEAYLRLSGYSRSELLTMTIKDIDVHLDLPAIQAKIENLEQHGYDCFETFHKAKDGRIWPVEVTVAYSSLQNGRLFSFLKDLSERKKTENELADYRHHLEQLVEQKTQEVRAALDQIQKSEARLNDAMDETNDGLWDWNIKTDITYCNPAYFRMLGYEPGELPNTAQGHWVDLLHPDDREITVAEAQQRLERDGVYELEFRMRTKDGHYKWILSRGKVVARDANGHPLRAIGTHTDLTARKQLEFELRQAKEQAELASLAKTRFLANMSHEIRTPLNAILGFTHLLRRTMTDSGQLEKLNKIQTSSKHLLSLINDILDLSKIEAEHLILEEVPFDLGSLLAEVIGIMTDRAQAKRVQLVEKIDPTLAAQPLLGDRMRIGQILLNYLSNAIKFTERGSVTLKATAEDRNEDTITVRFEVIDTGIGIDAADQQRIFHAFEQADTSVTRRYGGTGLGLTISYNLAQLMGGKVGVISRLGEGSQFWFSVPIKRGARGTTPQISESGSDVMPSTGKILLVEDDYFNQELAKELLSGGGLVIDVAQNGAEAVDKVKTSTYDLILMDIQMPVMNGIEATRHIRALPDGKNIPILAMTANAFAEDRQNCLAAGINDFLSKPISPKILSSALTRWLPKQPDLAPQNHTASEAALTPLPLPVGRHINITVGLDYFSGYQDNYLRMLAKFTELHSHDAIELQEAVNSGDRSKAKRIAHTLKGIAAQIGAERLHELTVTLERQLNTGADAADLLRQITMLSENLKQVCDEIGQLHLDTASPAVPDSASEAMSLSELRTRALELETLLKQDDINATTVWREIQPRLTELLGETKAEPLAKQIRDFDFPSAVSTLQGILANDLSGRDGE